MKRREWQFVPDRLMGRQNANGVDKEVKGLAQLEVSPDRTPGLHAWSFTDHYRLFNPFLHGILRIISRGPTTRPPANNINVFTPKLKFYIQLY